MVEAIDDRLQHLVDVAKIDEEPGAVVDLSLQHHLEAEAVAVQPVALVRGRQPRQSVRGLEAVLPGELDTHRCA